MEPQVLKAMLHYIYKETLIDEEPMPADSSSFSSTTETLIERLLAVADAQGLRRFRLRCESKLCRSISVNTVASTLDLAESCNATGLKAACLKFATQNLPEVMRSKGFECLQQKCPLPESSNVTGVKAACLKSAAKKLAEVMRSKGFECLQQKCPLLLSELLKAVAVFEDDCSSRESRRSVWDQPPWDQPSYGTDINDRRVRPRNSI